MRQAQIQSEHYINCYSAILSLSLVAANVAFWGLMFVLVLCCVAYVVLARRWFW